MKTLINFINGWSIVIGSLFRELFKNESRKSLIEQKKYWDDILDDDIKLDGFSGKSLYGNVENSLSYWIAEKEVQELNFKSKKKSILEKVSDILTGHTDYEGVEALSNYSEEKILALIEKWDLDTHNYVVISQNLADLRNYKKLIRAIENRIRSILGKIRKTLRNRKAVFKRQHSFHFKNLDDYHSLTLVSCK